MENTSCLICSSDDSEILYTGFDRLFGDDDVYNLVECRECCFIYLNPRPTQKELEKYYPPDYYSFKKWKQKTGLIKGIYRKAKWNYLNRFDGTRFMGVPEYKKNGRILDFGCGSGEVLGILKRFGWETYGVEKNEEAANFARSKGLEIYQHDIDSLDVPNDYFDVVRLRSVLEHLQEPSKILYKIHRVLKPEGQLLLIVPNIESLPAKIFKSRWYHLDIPRHLYQFSKNSLGRLLEKHSFRTVSTRSCGRGGILGSMDYRMNETRGSFGVRLYKSQPLRFITYVMIEFGLHLLRRGDLIEVRARKE